MRFRKKPPNFISSSLPLPLLTNSLFLLLPFFFSFFALPTLADCPPSSSIVYSPFVPVSASTYFQHTGSTNNGCWWWAGCVFSGADEARKQQFASVALIMGLIPLTIKDIAWPERRLVDVSRRLPVWLDVGVRAMGIVPNLVLAERGGKGKKAFASGRTYRWAMSHSRQDLGLCIAGAAVALGVGYAALAVLETFSKRSSLGCPYPVFVLTWHLLAVVPAAVMTWLGKDEVETMSPDVGSLQLEMEGDSRQDLGVVSAGTGGATSSSTEGVSSGRDDPKRTVMRSSTLSNRMNPGRETAFGVGPKEEFSPIPGRGMNWLIQLCWAIYYIAGTLVYTSIMAVTVIELFVWVVVSIEVAAASKMLAFLLCILYEKGER